MIEVISETRCTHCNICVRVCPMDVFDLAPRSAPVIARQDQCQTCFMCEAHCPVDAMYVAPMREPVPAGSPDRDEEHLAATGVLGSYRARLGWGEGRTPPRTLEQMHELASIGPRAG